MSAIVLSGTELSKKVKEEIAISVAEMKKNIVYQKI